MPPTTGTVAPAQFSLAPGRTTGNTVTRPGKLFETGVWPPAAGRPAGFSLSDAEADAVTGATVPIEIEHVRSILDGKLGTATFTGRNGADLNGFLTLPRVLNDLLGPGEPLPVSVVWDTATKRPLRVGLVLNPAITGAQVSAAFSASDDSRTGPTLIERMNGAAHPKASAQAKPPALIDRMNSVTAARDAIQTAFSGGEADTAAIYRRMNGKP